MLEIIYLYRWAVIVGLLSSITLVMLGIHLIERKKTVESITFGQGAVCGVLLYIGTIGSVFAFPPFIGAFVGFAFIYFLVFLFRKSLVARRNETMFVIYFLLVAMADMFVAMFPGLETHMGRLVMGNLVTASDGELLCQMIMVVVSGFFLIFYHKQMMLESFKISVWKKEDLVHMPYQKIFVIIHVVNLCGSIYVMGIVYTLTMLFVAPVVLSKGFIKGMKPYFLWNIISVFLATLGGFLISLHWDFLPTVPCMCLLLFAISSLILLINKFFVKA